MHSCQIHGAKKSVEPSDTPLKRPVEWSGLAAPGLIGEPFFFIAPDRLGLLATLL